jgi:hypothetical protein
VDEEEQSRERQAEREAEEIGMVVRACGSVSVGQKKGEDIQT